MNLKQLAHSLGLSPTTVSRALNGYPEVSAETRRRVEEAARLHNYRPNTRAQSLALGRAMAIGHVIAVSTSNEIVNPIFGDFIAGAGEGYAEAGYEMVLSITTDAGELDAYRTLAARRSVDGVIVHGPRRNDRRLPLLRDLGLPFVVHGRATGTDFPYGWVDVNNRRAFERATGVLLDLGHRRIALINGREEMDFALRRRIGFESALAMHGVQPDPALMFSGDMSEARGFEATRAFLAQPVPPTAILCSSIVSALGARRALEGAGLGLGRDVSVVIFDDDISYLRNGDAVPLFTAVRSSVRDAGLRAARMLLRQIANPAAAVETELLEAELLPGPSTGPAP